MAYDGKQLAVVTRANDPEDQIWRLKTTDAIATVDGAGYITDAKGRGLVKNAVIMVKQFSDDNYDTAIAVNWLVVNAVNADGTADLSDSLAGGTMADTD